MSRSRLEVAIAVFMQAICRLPSLRSCLPSKLAEPPLSVGMSWHVTSVITHCAATHACMCESGHIAYNSCRNRHCPKCQGVAAREWMTARIKDLLPVEYFHVVFTLPSLVADIAYQNKAVVYDLLFKASTQTLLTIAADPKHLGARIGMTSVKTKAQTGSAPNAVERCASLKPLCADNCQDLAHRHGRMQHDEPILPGLENTRHRTNQCGLPSRNTAGTHHQ